MAGAVMVILAGLFVAPFVLGAYAVAQKFSDRGQMTYFGFCTAFFVLVLLLGAVVLLLNP
jgi:hypothetical protein